MHYERWKQEDGSEEPRSAISDVDPVTRSTAIHPRSTFKRTALAASALVVATLAAYGPALRGGFIWDDHDHVTRNAAVQNPNGPADIWLRVGATPQYYPLVFTSFWIEHALWGLEPFGYHLDNVLLHALNALLLWRVLRRLSVPGAWLAAAVFALHPLQVESVAWITERKNVLSGAFCLAALLAYLRFAQINPQRGSDGDSPATWRWYALSLALFVAALLSKTVTCSLPAVILLVLWWKRRRAGGRAVLALVPMFAVGVALGLLTVWLEKHQIRAAGSEWDYSPVERCLIAGRALWFYLGKLVWPAQLTFWYPRWRIDAGQWQQFLYPAAFAGLLAALWLLRHRFGRAALVSLLIFAGTLVPALGFFDVYPMRFSFVADHFQYLAGIAPIALLTTLATLAFHARRNRTSAAPRTRPMPAAARLVAALLLGTLATLTWRQAAHYRTYETLLRDTLAKNPSAAVAHLNLGHVLQEQGRLEQAVTHFQEVVRLGPDAHKAHNNLGFVLERLGQIEDAVRHYRASIALDDRLPDPFNNLAWLLSTHADAKVRDGAEAVSLAERAVRLTGSRNPHFLDTLAAAYAEVGRYQEAIQTAQQAHGQLRHPALAPVAARVRSRIALYESGRPYRRPQ